MAINEVETLAEIPTGQEGNSIFVSLNETGPGRYVVDIRRWYVDDSDEWRPTQKGISIPVDGLVTVANALKDGNTKIAALVKARPASNGTKRAPAKKAPAAKAAGARKTAAKPAVKKATARRRA